MKCFNVALQTEYPFLKDGQLDCLLMDYPWDGENTIGWKRPALIVVPGGAYGMCSEREAAPIASEFFARGFQTFVLKYITEGADARYPEQLIELGAAVDYVKKHAKELNVNEKEIFVVGFSAGGHLTGNLAVEYANVSALAGAELNCKPTAVGLSYPVISKINGHQGSYENLLKGYAEEEQEKLLEKLNLDQAVTKDTVPSFIWATATDALVPADNALRFALALARNGVQYELHIYPNGLHGLATASLEINYPQPEMEKARAWIDSCASFFRMYTEEKY